jgi:hypothetical protein
MPPRKRAESKPTADPTLTPDAGAGSKAPGSDESDGTTPEPPETPEGPATFDAGAAPAGSDPGESDDKASAKSDLQQVEQPCTTCFPSGWPAMAFSVGCEHGTWIRDNRT